MKLQYLAFDGKVFESAVECEKYESIIRNNLVANINHYKHSKKGGHSLYKAFNELMWHKKQVKEAIKKFKSTGAYSLELRKILVKFEDAEVHYIVLLKSYKEYRRKLKAMRSEKKKDK